jgi:hypothetical protein
MFAYLVEFKILWAQVSLSYELFISPPTLPSGAACSYAPEDILFAAAVSIGDDSGTLVTLYPEYLL